MGTKASGVDDDIEQKKIILRIFEYHRYHGDSVWAREDELRDTTNPFCDINF